MSEQRGVPDSVSSLPVRAILKELGLQGKVSTYQMAKKWDNLKRRYKVGRHQLPASVKLLVAACF